MQGNCITKSRRRPVKTRPNIIFGPFSNVYYINWFARLKDIAGNFNFSFNPLFVLFSLAVQKLLAPEGWIDITMTMGVSGLFQILKKK